MDGDATIAQRFTPFYADAIELFGRSRTGCIGRANSSHRSIGSRWVPPAAVRSDRPGVSRLARPCGDPNPADAAVLSPRLV